jgi:FAD-linked oxidoreductase
MATALGGGQIIMNDRSEAWDQAAFATRRRELLKGGLAVGATLALPAALGACSRRAAPAGYGHGRVAGEWANWSGGQTSRPAAYLQPASEDELAKLLQRATGPVRVTGAGHSFSPVCQTDGALLTLDGMKGLIRHDAEKQQATFWAGTRVHEVGEPLQAIGQGLLNQGDVDPQSLGGAIGTSTHGTGPTLGSFSAAVRGLRLVTAEGEVLDCDPGHNADLFHAACTSVGALGIVTQITFQNRAAYKLRERIFTAPLSEVYQNLERWRDENRHFEFWAFYEADRALVKTLNETEDEVTPPAGFTLPEDEALWAACEIAHGLPSSDGFMQRLLMRLASGSERVGRSYRIFPSARNTRFNEMEYEVPAARGAECVQEVLATVRKSGINALFPIEYRYVAADDCWLSPFYRQDSCAISIHQYHKVDYRPLFALVEPILRRHGGRPHWGKLHTLAAADFAALYPRWEDFRKLRRELDPRGRLLNLHLRAVFGA